MTSATSKPFLILGGTGKTGRRLAERLKAKNIPVRIGSRSATPAFYVRETAATGVWHVNL